MVGLLGARDHGKMESKLVEETITNGKNDERLQMEAR